HSTSCSWGTRREVCLPTCSPSLHLRQLFHWLPFIRSDGITMRAHMFKRIKIDTQFQCTDITSSWTNSGLDCLSFRDRRDVSPPGGTIVQSDGRLAGIDRL